MRFPSEEVIRNLREHYPAGTRVELLQMDDTGTADRHERHRRWCG